MKLNLGRFILLFLLTTFLQASEYEWSVQVNKKEAHVNEAIHLHYSCNYKNSAELYVIEFNPTIDNKNYKIVILREDEKIVNGKKINEYEFVLFVKKAGQFSLSLDTLMKKTNKDSIENGMLGRDNANYEEFSLYPYKQKRVEINILETQSPMVGEFTFSVRQDKSELEAYEPFHLEFLVSGLGDFQVFKDVFYEIEGVEVFSEAAKEEIVLTADGYKGTWRKKFAFVSDKNFSIPALETKYFDLKEKKLKTLHFDGLDIVVSPVKFNKEQLLDPKKELLTFDTTYLYYLVTFIAGFLLAKIKFIRPKVQDSDEQLFCKRVQEVDTLEKLSFILVTHDAQKYKELIFKIENKELTSLKKLKNLICS
ncbi:BatD [hydrothermal vent metagenome]|uniref:BatD n=1 Tax=hydrothermal vent metagenome TaxID=652676 RepID=A0A1W1CGP7_9ZZZZ